MYWIKIAESSAELFNSGRQLVEVKVAGREITIGKVNNQLHACTSKCPHAGGRISHGYIDAQGNFVCPLHRYKFNPANGFNVSGEGYRLKTFAIKENDDGVFVSV